MIQNHILANGILCLKTNQIQYILNSGCGKGIFASKLSSLNKDINYIAIDMIEAMLGISNRNTLSINKDLDNILLIRLNVDNIDEVFSKEDQIERIYINFCNPWPKPKHNKRRLTFPLKLEKYKKFLKKNGKIYFKTDSDELFEDTLKYLKQEGFEIEKITYDLHSEDIFGNNIETEHEIMFKDKIKIKALIAKEAKND